MPRASTIFVSYARTDEVQVRPFEACLRAAGYSVWFDQHDIRAGENFTDNIMAAIQGCSAFVLMASKTSFTSDFVFREYMWAERHGKLVVPVLLADLNSFKPGERFIFHLGEIQYTEEYRIGQAAAVDEVLATLRKHEITPDTEPSSSGPQTPPPPDGRKEMILGDIEEAIAYADVAAADTLLRRYQRLDSVSDVEARDALTYVKEKKEIYDRVGHVLRAIREEMPKQALMEIFREEFLKLHSDKPMELLDYLYYVWREVTEHVEDIHHPPTVSLFLRILREHIAKHEGRRAGEALKLFPDMVVVPSGPFRLPPNFKRSSLHCFLTGYLIDRHPVTNAQYEEFLADIDLNPGKTPKQHPLLPKSHSHVPRSWRPGAMPPDLPVVGVSWFNAQAYADWRGKRLPKEAEWIRAVFATSEEGSLQTYPWGDEPMNGKRVGNFGGQRLGVAEVTANPEGGSPLGVIDAVGNAWEWTSDWWGDNSLVRRRILRDPRGCAWGDARVVRGGDRTMSLDELDVHCRSKAYPVTKSASTGFRCAVSFYDVDSDAGMPADARSLLARLGAGSST